MLQAWSSWLLLLYLLNWFSFGGRIACVLFVEVSWFFCLALCFWSALCLSLRLLWLAFSQKVHDQLNPMHSVPEGKLRHDTALLSAETLMSKEPILKVVLPVMKTFFIAWKQNPTTQHTQASVSQLHYISLGNLFKRRILEN